jgi:hypothetical protein
VIICLSGTEAESEVECGNGGFEMAEDSFHFGFICDCIRMREMFWDTPSLWWLRWTCKSSSLLEVSLEVVRSRNRQQLDDCWCS